MLAGRSALTNMLSESKRLFELLYEGGYTRWGCSVVVFCISSDRVGNLFGSCWMQYNLMSINIFKQGYK